MNHDEADTPDNRERDTEQARGYLQEGDEAFKTGEMDEAAGCYDTALNLFDQAC